MLHILLLVLLAAEPARTEGLISGTYTTLMVKPSQTDATIRDSDLPSYAIYDASSKPGNLLLFLNGTGGVPPGPVRFLTDAVAHGYRVISLSYVDVPAVAQVCVGQALEIDPDCAQAFRERRIYGDGRAPIDDAPQDAIVNRLTKLLQYLTKSDPRGQWERYLDGDTLRWDRIALSGQSQGGGMAEYIAQRSEVARVLVFSGGWDHSRPGSIAGWYRRNSATPADRWFATYNEAEVNAKVLSQTYAALGIPATHVFALNRPVQPGGAPHGDGISNPAYTDVWNTMLGDGEL